MTPKTNRHRVAAVLAFASLLFAVCPGPADAADAPTRGYKILHIMSYHPPWRWTDGQLAGFKEAFKDQSVDYKVFQMDAKQFSSIEAKEQKGKEAMALIEAWKPDLVYTSDDDAQQYVARHYVGRDLPFVFSGVNLAPASYGFEGSRNVTGILEQEHFVESVKLLQGIVPGVKRIAAVFDDAPMWAPVRARMQARLAQLPGVEIVAWDTIRTFEEYKERIAAYPGMADAIALIGIFNFKDAAGRNVPYQEVQRWTAEHSTLPDLSFWIDRVHYGTLAAVTVSEREQGLAAGRIARAILVDGKSPADFAMEPTAKGVPVISLARVNALGLKVNSSLLLSAEIVRKFDWSD